MNKNKINTILKYKEPDIEGNRFTYPFIGNHKGSKDLVVLFTDKRIGYVLRKNQYNKVLHFKNHWNMACFEPFNGTLAIE